MILINELNKIVLSQKENLEKLDTGIERDFLKNVSLKTNHAIILSGIRRCGKSTLMHQVISRVSKYNYFNFEDPRALYFEISDFDKLIQVFSDTNASDYFFFDEIQNVEKWELLIRQLLNRNKKVFVTGSNASLLSKELGTKLTGRHLRHELLPFSFSEFLSFMKLKASSNSFEKYFNMGGFPEFLKFRDIRILQELLNDIITRDISVRYGLRNTRVIKDLALYLISNVGKEFSYHKLKNIFGVGSTNSIINYISYFEDSYLFFTVPKFNYSYQKQVVAPKKVYAIDPGLIKANSVSFSEDKGRVLENIVYLNLRKAENSIYYFTDGNECDFVVSKSRKLGSAIQVCWELNEENKNREIKGLLSAMEFFDLKQGQIITYNQSDEFKKDNRHIEITPVWKWILENG
ncbi:MAG: ATP-binding protein [Melioribacteraceae bacterium]|nr:ATP-binding protein [Melioribacteraceae bacterium]MCF8355419.1 ATP-binding protein [Melioribacteraceae bacterium]MCF8393261.1 ATP-binding protein [Melioribacteraceae bacterium]MCF8417562.1 ATP-binding protein [Melioribacteraceae bacterium]